MKAGDTVRLKAYGGREIERTVIQYTGDSVIVCKPEEYKKARMENRPPMCVAFNVKYIIESSECFQAGTER